MNMRNFQSFIASWVVDVFGQAALVDIVERRNRMLEEAVELAQASGASRDECIEMVNYVYDRPQGDVNQEVGGLLVTTAALCEGTGVDMKQSAQDELRRIHNMKEKIRAKQAAKPEGVANPQYGQVS